MLDGRTLTGELRLSGVPRSTRGLALVFTKADGTSRRYELPAAGSRDQMPLRIAVPLEGSASPDLRPGRWRVGLDVKAGTRNRVLPVRGHWNDDERGPTLWNPRSPVTGRRYRPVMDRHGNLALTAKAYAPHAEVDRFTVAASTVEITGRRIGKGIRDATGAATVVVRDRASGQERELPATLRRRTFVVSFPLERIASEDASTWSATLHAPGGPPLSLKKRLSDLRDLPGIIRYPAAELPTGARLVAAYAADGVLILSVTAPPPPVDHVEPPA